LLLNTAGNGVDSILLAGDGAGLDTGWTRILLVMVLDDTAGDTWVLHPIWLHWTTTNLVTRLRYFNQSGQEKEEEEKNDNNNNHLMSRTILHYYDAYGYFDEAWGRLQNDPLGKWGLKNMSFRGLQKHLLGGV
jgi:hypothetical protein